MDVHGESLVGPHSAPAQVVRPDTSASAAVSDAHIVEPESGMSEYAASSTGDYTVEERKLVRKLDRRILPLLCLLYLFAYLDRTNLGNARLQGLPQDVLGGDPTGRLFDLVTSAFFVSYVRILLLLACKLAVLRYYKLDHLPNPLVDMLENGLPSHLDRGGDYWLGSMLYPHGAFLVLSPSTYKETHNATVNSI
ncbi:hypothetical protein HWV62_37751 [Athelia sp. TMB]|nr:hypothetical protein HWV62_37751 [Athelia sp. TMB]